MRLIEYFSCPRDEDSPKFSLDYHVSGNEIKRMKKRNAYRERIGFDTLPMPTHRTLTVVITILSKTYYFIIRLSRLPKE